MHGQKNIKSLVLTTRIVNVAEPLTELLKPRAITNAAISSATGII